jgi:RimJ/RimL family protein N-acetyltransferase
VARSLYEAVGFELEGTKRKSRKVDGRYQDELLMALRFQVIACA